MSFRIRHLASIIVFFSIVTFALTSPNSASADPIYWDEIGHYYDVITFESPLAWDMAYLDAAEQTYKGERGYLATVTSAEENEFIGSTFNGLKNYALGGYQEPDAPEPSTGWKWITGELFDYQNWVSGEPNDMGGEDYLAIGYTNNREWNDVLWTYGYVVEFGKPGERVPGDTPEPATALLIASAAGLAAVVRKKYGKPAPDKQTL